MYTESLFLFLILLLGLLLCSFLGGKSENEGFEGNFAGTFSTNVNNSTNSNLTSSDNYDNYNHFTGVSSKLPNGSIFIGPNGGTILVKTNTNGFQSLKVKISSLDLPIEYLPQNYKSENYKNKQINEIFYGPNGEIARVIYKNNGEKAINLQNNFGSFTFSESGNFYNPDNTTSTQYFGSTGNHIQKSNSTLSYQGPYNGSIKGSDVNENTTLNPYNNNFPYNGNVSNTLQNNNSTLNNNNSTLNNNNSTLNNNNSDGIPSTQIIPGKEDLYILKSEIVPPVCPACPAAASCPRQEPCPPCPACARCPEPAFECKKVPNYNAIDNQYLPQPILNNFSQFGM
jgi:hypothetical protein